MFLVGLCYYFWWYPLISNETAMLVVGLSSLNTHFYSLVSLSSTLIVYRLIQSHLSSFISFPGMSHFSSTFSIFLYKLNRTLSLNLWRVHMLACNIHNFVIYCVIWSTVDFTFWNRLSTLLLCSLPTVLLCSLIFFPCLYIHHLFAFWNICVFMSCYTIFFFQFSGFFPCSLCLISLFLSLTSFLHILCFPPLFDSSLCFYCSSSFLSLCLFLLH